MKRCLFENNSLINVVQFLMRYMTVYVSFQAICLNININYVWLDETLTLIMSDLMKRYKVIVWGATICVLIFISSYQGQRYVRKITGNNHSCIHTSCISMKHYTLNTRETPTPTLIFSSSTQRLDELLLSRADVCPSFRPQLGLTLVKPLIYVLSNA